VAHRPPTLPAHVDTPRLRRRPEQAGQRRPSLTGRLSQAARRSPAWSLLASTTGTTRVWLLTVVLVGIAAGLAALELGTGSLFEAPLALPWYLLAILFYVAEAKVIHLHIGRSAHSFSMSEIPVVYGIFFLSPAQYIVARLGGAGLALVFSRRQRSVKLAFNLAQFLLCSVVTLGIVHVLDDTAVRFGPHAWGTA
jgi:hypothetical protein